MTAFLTYNWFWLLLFGSVGLVALVVLLLIVYQLARIAKAIEKLVFVSTADRELHRIRKVKET